MRTEVRVPNAEQRQPEQLAAKAKQRGVAFSPHIFAAAITKRAKTRAPKNNRKSQAA